MLVRDMTEEDRTLANSWLSLVIRRVFPLEFHPRSGVAVFERDTVYAVIPVYLEESTPVAVMGHCMVNPALSKQIKHEAVRTALVAAENYALRCGKKYLLGYFGNRAVNAIAGRLGFLTGDEQVIQTVKYVR